MMSYDFNDLFVFDLANNHNGDVAHGQMIINALGPVCQENNVQGALKFQFRQIDTFIHPDYLEKKDAKHIPWFISTALTAEEYKILTQTVVDNNMRTICTPFDEESVDVILDLDIEIIKVASCSADDYPLLEKIARANKPVIASTAGLNLDKIDRLVSFFEFKKIDFALMHCIALYPTPFDKLKLNHINVLRERYPQITIGFSTHEDPDNYQIIPMAYAKGARIFERHVGIENEKYKLNKYSSTPEHVANWIQSYKNAVAACGGENFSPAYPDEIESLNSLKRGVYAQENISEGDVLSKEKVFFSMPLHEGQLTSGNWVKDLKADKTYPKNATINGSVSNLTIDNDERIYRIMLQVKGMLNNARIFIGKDSSIELSHHYGLDRFREFGAVIIDCINRQYCKKLIIQLPRQKHPYHYHKKKEETFQLLYGDMEVLWQGHRKAMQPGDLFLVKPGEWHKFHTLDGAIFEEVSTTHYNDDSYYEDERIAGLPREVRKTVIPNWEAMIRNAV